MFEVFIQGRCYKTFLQDKWNLGILMTFSQVQISGDDSWYGAITIQEFSGIPEFDIWWEHVLVIQQIDRILFFYPFFFLYHKKGIILPFLFLLHGDKNWRGLSNCLLLVFWIVDLKFAGIFCWSCVWFS